MYITVVPTGTLMSDIIMAAKESAPVKTEHTTHYISSDKKTSNVQSHLTDGNNSQISSNLTPLFDREEHLKGPDVSYNEASSSEESDYNQASVIFSLDELQTSLTGLRVSVSPEVPAVEHKNSAGLLFPSLIQDDEKVSVSSKEDSDQNNELDLNSPPPENRDDIVIADNKTCSANEAQPDTVVTSDSLLYHVHSNSATVHSMTEVVVPVTPPSLTIEDSSLIDVALDDCLNNNKLTSTDTSPQVEASHIETSSSVATITQSSPADTPTANNGSASGTEQLGETELSISVCSSNPDIHHEKPTDSISSMSISSCNKPLSEKLKPTQNTFESPGLLYAHPVKKSSKKVVETLEPAEAATEALLAEEKLAVATSQTSHHIRAKVDKRGEIFIDQTHLPSFNYKNLTGEAHVHYCVILVNVTTHSPIKTRQNSNVLPPCY